MSPIVKVVQPVGILDATKAKQLRHHISDVVTTGVDIVLIDLQDVTFIDSSGLGGLISAQRIVKAANSKLFLCSINNQVRMLFEMTKMHQVFEIFTDQEKFNNMVLSIC